MKRHPEGTDAGSNANSRALELGVSQGNPARIDGSGVGITSCIGFPLGAASTAAKVAEAKQSVADGTTEIDMVINGGHLVAGDDVLTYRTSPRQVENE